jgi:hypothetical protein
LNIHAAFLNRLHPADGSGQGDRGHSGNPAGSPVLDVRSIIRGWTAAGLGAESQ